MDDDAKFEKVLGRLDNKICPMCKVPADLSNGWIICPQCNYAFSDDPDVMLVVNLKETDQINEIRKRENRRSSKYPR